MEKLCLIETRQTKMEDRMIQLTPAEDELLTRAQFCAKYDISFPTVARWERAGVIKGVRKGRRVYYQKMQ